MQVALHLFCVLSVSIYVSVDTTPLLSIRDAVLTVSPNRQ